ncbi:MAG: hypothetical protein V1709_08875 [Planctomycetota bacterium]
MAAKKYYIPKRDDDLFNWQGNFVNLVVANAVAWAIPPADVTALSARRASYEPLYHAAQNKAQRSKDDVLAHRQMRKTYEKEIRTLARQYLMNSPLVSDTDRVNLGLTVRDTEPSPGKPITDVPVVVLRPLGGGDIETRVKPTKDQTRPSMHPDANLVEYRYVIVESGDVPPADPDDCPKGDVQTKAKFVLRCGAKNTAKRFYGFFRWLNNRRPRQEGPWSNAQPVVIA